MKQKLFSRNLLLIGFIACGLYAAGQYKYVRNSGTSGTGDSWASPYVGSIGLQTALSTGGVITIFMEEGTYNTTTDMGSNVSYSLPANITIQGSFTTGNLTVYDPVNHPSIINNGGRPGHYCFIIPTGVPTVAFKGFQVINSINTVLLGGLYTNGSYLFQDFIIKYCNDVPIFLSGTGGTINYSNCLFYQNSDRIRHTISSPGTVTMDKCVFQGPDFANAGALQITGGATNTISNSSFCNFSTSTSGGAINATTGRVAISNTSFSYNTTVSAYQGGAIFAYQYTNISLDSVTFYNNGAKNGGAPLDPTVQGADIYTFDNTAVLSSITNCYMQLPAASFYATPAGSYTFGSGNVFNNNSGIKIPPACANNIILPTTGLYLVARAINGVPKLDWSTLSEHNSNYFNIQSSAESNSFTTIGKITAAGNSDVETKYSYTDNAATGNVVYYRIESVDKDGTATYSNVVAVRLSGAPTTCRVFPNPATNLINIETGAAGTYMIDLFANDGRKIQSSKLSTASGILSFNINRAAVTTGIYVVKTTDIKSNSSNYSTILIK